MSQPSSLGTPPLDPLRTAQIVWAAVTSSAVLASVVILFVAKDFGVQSADADAIDPQTANQAVPVVAYAAAALAAWVVGLRWFFSERLPVSALRTLAKSKSQAVSSLRSEETFPVYQRSTLLGWALLESGVLFNIIAYKLNAQSFSLGVATFLFLILATSFPTRDRVQAWTEKQLRAAQER